MAAALGAGLVCWTGSLTASAAATPESVAAGSASAVPALAPGSPPDASLNPCDAPLIGSVCSIPGKVIGGAVDSVAKTVTKWIADGATGILGATLAYAQTSLDPGLSSNPGCPGCVSSAQLGGLLLRMRALAGAVGVVFLFLVVIQALLRADASVIGEGLKRLVLAGMVTAALVWGTAVLMGVADQMTAYVIGDSLQQNAGDFIRNLGDSYQTEIEAGTTPLFFIAISALLTVLVGFLLFIEFAIRTAVIDLALLFFPLLLVASVWQPASRGVRRLADVLITAIFSKFVILVTLGLAAALFADSSSKPLTQGIGQFVVGVVVLLLSVLAPIALLSFVSHAPEAAASIAGVHRGGGAAVMSTTGTHASRLASAGSTGGASLASTPILMSSSQTVSSSGQPPLSPSGGGGQWMAQTGFVGGGAAGPPRQAPLVPVAASPDSMASAAGPSSSSGGTTL